MHSAVERRLTAAIGAPAERLHTGRSRNEQVALDMRLWLRGEIAGTAERLAGLAGGLPRPGRRARRVPLPGYTHLRRAMPSSVADWAAARTRAPSSSTCEELARLHACAGASARWARAAGYGVPLDARRGPAWRASSGLRARPRSP